MKKVWKNLIYIFPLSIRKMMKDKKGYWNKWMSFRYDAKGIYTQSPYYTTAIKYYCMLLMKSLVYFKQSTEKESRRTRFFVRLSFCLRHPYNTMMVIKNLPNVCHKIYEIFLTKHTIMKDYAPLHNHNFLYGLIK